MEKRKPLRRWVGILLVFTAVTFLGLEADEGKEGKQAPVRGPADLIQIDTMAAFGKLEMPPVAYFHDKHTDALLKEKKSCETCHFRENGKLSLAFKRKQGTRPEALKEIYHGNCIGCHQEMVAAKKKSGPLDGFCRDCHNARPPTAVRLDAGLDKVLHYRHIEDSKIKPASGQKDNCSVCHHDYDKKAKKLVAAPGQENSCRYCHLEKGQSGVKSLKQASHEQCILCHLDLAQTGSVDNFPVRCADCHSAQAQALVAKKNGEVLAGLKNNLPRLHRGQPDEILLTATTVGPQGSKAVTMDPVPFDHQAHEKYSDSCRVCHHASMDACARCHTLAGSREGGGVTFEQSMHLKSSQHSCIGCHNAQKAGAACLGCHQSMVETGKPDSASCKQCHRQLPQGVQAGEVAKMTPQQRAGLAGTLLKGRNLAQATYAQADIPETVVIKKLSDKYLAVEMPHRQHVVSLMKGMQDSRLAGFFHSDPGTVCQGCHHHSPLSKTPPRCVSCHAKTVGQASFDPREANRPGLLAAYHGQCMSCHQAMAVKPAATACLDCHKEKK
jgi:hypothetical protein